MGRGIMRNGVEEQDGMERTRSWGEGREEGAEGKSMGERGVVDVSDPAPKARGSRRRARTVTHASVDTAREPHE